MSHSKMILAAGDIVAIILVTVIGFVTHGEANLSFLPRIFAAFVPLMVAWFLLSPWFGLFQNEIIFNIKQIWRPAYVMLFAASFAVVFRGLILNAPIIPVFAVVFGITSAFGMLIWRGSYFFFFKRK